MVEVYQNNTTSVKDRIILNRSRETTMVEVCQDDTTSVKDRTDLWVEICPHPNHFNLPKKKKIYFGEGEMESEGFIALVDESNNLIWSFFSTNSSPFIEVAVKGNIIFAKSTSSLMFEIPLTEPEGFQVKGYLYK